jgi:tetratricopeptide (TPR) repeat protein
MKQLLISAILFLTIGCAGIGLMATSNPDKKIQQAYQMMNRDRALMAEDLIRQAMDIYEKEDNTLGIAEAYHTYGLLYKDRVYHGKSAATFKKFGRYDGTYMKSVNNFLKAKEYYEKAHNEVGVVKSLTGAGSAYILRNEDIKACQYYKEALSRYRAGKKDGRIKEEPIIFDKRFKNLGQIIEAFLKQEGCST